MRIVDLPQTRGVYFKSLLFKEEEVQGPHQGLHIGGLSGAIGNSAVESEFQGIVTSAL